MTRYRAECDQCGFTGTYRTPGLAGRALRQHSCEWQTHRATQRRRGEQRRAAVDRTPKPCPHKIAAHQHGTRACYCLDGCRCEPCSAANRDAERQRTRQKAYGRYDKYRDADKAREHVRALMASGMGLKRIVAVSDLSQGMLWKLVYGKRLPDGTRRPSRRVLADTEARILAVKPDLADGARTDATGTRRRLQALVALGHTQTRLAELLDVSAANFAALLDRDQVLVGTARKVTDLYERLSMTLPQPANRWQQGAVTRARARAAANGWAPPLAWDDDAIDNPDAHPAAGGDRRDDDSVDESVVERILAGDNVAATPAERVETVRRWQTTGRPLRDLERLTGWKADRYRQDTRCAG